MSDYHALIFGCTGMVGSSCLHKLLENPQYSRVTAISRRPLAVTHSKLHSIVTDFDTLSEEALSVKADHVFCAMGSTRRKAGSKKAFLKSDYEYPYKLAEIALKNGAQGFYLVSAVGADASSMLFYSQVKGKLEKAIADLPYPAFFSFRPSVLLGNRQESRPGEAVMMWVTTTMPFLFSGPLARYRGIPADVVADAMIQAALSHKQGVHFVENEEIFTWAQQHAVPVTA